jgi:hypothetical protein
MTRLLVCGMLLFGASAMARAGELDKEGAPAKAQLTAKATAAAPTEMDKETPQPAHRYRGYAGYRVGFGVGFGYGSFYGGYGYGYRPYYSVGFGYPAYYYSPYRYSVGYYPYGVYGGYGCW